MTAYTIIILQAKQCYVNQHCMLLYGIFWSWLTFICISKLVDKHKRQDPTVSTATYANQLQNTTATACNADRQNFHSLQNEVATYFAFHSDKWQCTQASGWLQLLARQLQGCVHVDKYLRVLLVTEKRRLMLNAKEQMRRNTHGKSLWHKQCLMLSAKMCIQHLILAYTVMHSITGA